MGSYYDGKEHMKHWVQDHIKAGSTCLDVGACDGIWADLLGNHLQMDAVEIYILCHPTGRKKKAPKA